MKRATISIILLLCILNLRAQPSTFDIFKFDVPSGWKKNVSADGYILSYEKVNNKTREWGKANIVAADRSKGSAAADFSYEWEEMAVKQYKVTDLKEMDSIDANGWVIKAGTGSFTYNGKRTNVMLTTFTGMGMLAAVVTMNTGKEFVDPLAAFIESMEIDDAIARERSNHFSKPDPLVKNNAAPPADNSPVSAGSGNFVFTRTNFDNGWVSVIKEDWVEVSKGDLKVYLFYAIPFNRDQVLGYSQERRDYYWDNVVARHFKIETKQYHDPEFRSMTTPQYVEGWARDPEANERRFIGMRVTNNAQSAYVVVVSAKQPQDIYAQFPKAYDGDTDDISGMSGYNKFAVALSDIVGKWTDGGNTQAAEFYYASPAGYSYGGVAIAASAADFDFHADGTYTSRHRGATGSVANMMTFDQNYKGKITVTDWQITATNRFDGETGVFEVYFVAVKGGRILKMSGVRAGSWSLVRSKD